MRRILKYCCPECGTINPPPQGQTFGDSDNRFCDVNCYRTWYKEKKNKYVRHHQPSRIRPPLA